MGCERRIRLWALVCIRAYVTVSSCTYGSLYSCFMCACSVSVCFCEFTIAYAYVYISTYYSVCAHILLIYTCVYLLRTLSLCVCPFHFMCGWECTHVNVFPHQHLLMQSAIMCTAPLISLLCMVTVLWKSRDVCTSAVYSIKRCMVMQYKQAHSFNKSPPLPCVEWKQPLIHSLGVTTDSLWLLGFTAHTCLVSGNPCYAVYTGSCPVKGHLACLTSWPPQSWGRISHFLALVL